MKLEIFQEVCCEKHNKVVRVRFNCPKCLCSFSESDRYTDMESMLFNEDIVCGSCGTIFVLENKNGSIDYNKWDFRYGS